MDIDQVIFFVEEKKRQLAIKGIRAELFLCHPKTESKLLNYSTHYQALKIWIDHERPGINRFCDLRCIVSLYLEEDEIIVK